MQGRNLQRRELARPRAGGPRRAREFRPSKLSGGERQRVAIARALVGRPAIVLADEPTGNLDSASGASVLELLEMHAQAATILVITHDHDLAARLPRQVQVLDGQIVADTLARPDSRPYEAQIAPEPTTEALEGHVATDTNDGALER